MRTPLKGLAIRPMSREDLAEVMALERQGQGPGWSVDNYLSELRNRSCHAFVTHTEHQVVGYLIFWIVCDEAYLLNLTVRRGFRRNGIGRKLMAFLIEFSRSHGTSWIGLEVRKSNRPAQALYTEFGFRQTRIRKGYYQDNHEDGIVMELELDCETP